MCINAASRTITKKSLLNRKVGEYNMNKYECSKCGKEVVTNSREATLNLKCCSGDTPVGFKKAGTKIVVAVAKDMPKAPLPAGSITTSK